MLEAALLIVPYEARIPELSSRCVLCHAVLYVHWGGGLAAVSRRLSLRKAKGLGVLLEAALLGAPARIQQ